VALSSSDILTNKNVLVPTLSLSFIARKSPSRRSYRLPSLAPSLLLCYFNIIMEEQQQPQRGNPFLLKPLWVAIGEKNTGQHIDDDGAHHDDDGGIELPPFHCNDQNDADDDRPDEQTTQQQTAAQSNKHHAPPPRHLTLFDLVSIGVGGTIGSGIFVLNGLIAHSYAGPATFISWIISGFAALLSGCCYAELSGRIPSAGSSYAYAYVALGELPAFVVAGMLTLEFLLSGSAVARSWGDKVVEWLRIELSARDTVINLMQPGFGINPMACLVSIVTTMLVLGGVKESKLVTDVFTWIKVGLVIFMTVGGYVLFDSSNMVPVVPPEFGASGVFRGAISSFFGYLGFDAVCCVAGEAINAERNLPLSIMITLGIVTSLYVTAAIALVGMQHYNEISTESGFPEAFKANGVEWAAQLTAAGEVLTLPVVVLISVVIQPRLQYACAKDGLLPPMFGEIDETGNPRKGALFAGVLMTIFATFIPFEYLDDFVSAGILIAFSTTNCSLVIMRRESPQSDPSLLAKLLAGYNLSSFLTCITISHGLHLVIGWLFAVLFGILCIVLVVKISRQCPPSSTFGNVSDVCHMYDTNKRYFSTPWVPAIPCLGIFVNYMLISQLSMFGICLLLTYCVLLVVFYFIYGARHSVGRKEGWSKRHYAMVNAQCNNGDVMALNATIT
jgi:APA family basic amino acid/polyamine antiporter